MGEAVAIASGIANLAEGQVRALEGTQVQEDNVNPLPEPFMRLMC